VSVVIFSTCDKIFELEIKKKKNLTDVSNQINQPPYLLINKKKIDVASLT
jgi:hypothetical protein